MLLLSAFYMGQEKPEVSYNINSSLPEKAVGGNLGLKVLGREREFSFIALFSFPELWRALYS